MVNYNKTVNGIPMFKARMENGTYVDVVSGRFLEKYFDRVSGDTKCKTTLSSDFYKMDDDYIINPDISDYTDLNLFTRPRNDSYDVMFTKSGAEKYIHNLQLNRNIKNKENNINKAFDEISKKNNNSMPLELFDIITDGCFNISFIIDLIRHFLKDFNEYDLYDIIDGNFEIKTKITHEKVGKTSVPKMISYIEKNVVEYVFMNLYKNNMLTKSEVLFLIRKILEKQMRLESCA